MSGKGPVILESEKDKVIQQVEEDERCRKIVACVSEGNDIETEQRMQYWMTRLQERPGTDKGHMDMTECAIGWAVETRRERKGTEQEQGKTVHFGEEEH